MMCFQGKCIPCRLTEQPIHLIARQEIYKVLTGADVSGTLDPTEDVGLDMVV